MKTTKVRRPLRLVEETRNCGDELAGYFVHDPNTGADATVADFESGLAAYHRGGHAAALPREFTGRSDKDCHQPIKLAKYHHAGA